MSVCSKPIFKGMIWAMALILLAFANRLGLVEDKDLSTMFVLLPAMALVALFGGNACHRIHDRTAQ